MTHNTSYWKLLTKSFVIIILIAVVSSYTGLSAIAQSQDANLSALQKSSSTANDLKSGLTSSEKKLSFELLQLLNSSLLPGETIDEKKSDMEKLNQLIPATEIATQSTDEAAGDLVHVYITFEPYADITDIESYTWNVTDIDYKSNFMVAWVDVNDLERLASLSDVRNVEPVVPPMVNAVTQGDAILNATYVRSLYNTTGVGIKVGVISNGVTGLSTAVASGDLPSNVTVLSNNVGGSEGTAMLEIVHDIAPDAQLYFHDYGDGSSISFTRAINDLINNGTTIIIDDCAYYTSPYFEDGYIASNITEQVKNKNIVYITAADNFAMGHYQGQYYDDGTGHNDFSQGTSSNKKIYYDIPKNGHLLVVLEWNDPWGASSNDYDLFLNNSTTGALIAYSAGNQNGTQNPLEYFSYYNNNSHTVRAYLDVKNYSAPSPRMLEVMTVLGSNYVESYNTNKSDSIFGQAAASSVIAAGAISAGDPGNDDIEPYSSQGPVTIYYPSYETRLKPDICGIDGVNVSGAGGFSTPFYGTSAAAPHIGAIAALIWSAYPAASADDIRNCLKWSAIDLGTPGNDNVFGYGRADGLKMFSLPNGTITGYVNITGIGIPLSNVNVNLVNASNSSQIIASTTTGSNGIYTFNNIPSLGDLPNYKLSIARSGFYDNSTASFGILNDNVNWVNASMVNTTPLPVIQLNATAYAVNETAGILYVNVTRANDYADSVGVTLTTTAGTATSPTDYSAVTTPVTFASGQMSILVPITINDDLLYSQLTKQFSVQLIDPAGAASIGMNQSALVTISENDPAPVLNFSSVSYNVSDSNSIVTITVNRSNDAINPVTVQYNTSNVTAKAGLNYTTTNGTLTFTKGEMSHTIQVPILGSQVSNVTFNVTLSNSTGGATLGVPSKTIVTITSTTYTFTQHLNQGWNLISFPVLPEDTNITRLLPTDVRAQINVIWAYNGSGIWNYWTELDGYTNTLNNVDNQHGYLIYCYNPVSFNVTGTRPESDQIPLRTGDYTIIGYLKQDPIDPATQYNDTIVVWGFKNGSWYYYTPLPGYTSTLTSMEPGYGYEVYK